MPLRAETGERDHNYTFDLNRDFPTDQVRDTLSPNVYNSIAAFHPHQDFSKKGPLVEKMQEGEDKSEKHFSGNTDGRLTGRRTKAKSPSNHFFH